MNNCYILWYIFHLSVEHFWRFVLDQQDGFGSTNFSTAFRLRNCHFFLSCFHSFIFLCQFLSYFLDVFFAFLPSLTQSSHPRPLLQTRGNDHLLQTLRSTIPRSWLTQKVRAVLWSERLCTDLRFSVMETVAVILSCRCQVKDWQFNIWKENIVFSPQKKEIEKNKKWK